MKLREDGTIELDSMAELKGRLNVDSKDEFNVDHLIFLKKGVYDDMEVPLTHIPLHLSELKCACPNGHKFTPNWLEKRPPNSPTRVGKGFLRPSQEYCFCTICGTKTLIDMDSRKPTAEISFYGDEAIRHVNNKTYAIYTFVCFNGPKGRKRNFYNKLNKIKRKMSPKADPASWQIHLKELIDAKKRGKTRHLSHLTSSKVDHYIKEICKIVKQMTVSNDMTIICGISRLNIGNPDKDQLSNIKFDAFSSAVNRLIYDSTSNGISPRIKFERTGKDGWAIDFFKSSRLTLFWTFLTHSVEIPSPSFVPPSHDPLLEISDLACYIVARHIFDWEEVMPGTEATPRFHTKSLGRILYQITMNNGDWHSYLLQNLPIRVIQNGVGKEDYIKKYPDMYFVKTK